MRRHFLFATALATVHRHQLPLLHIKLLCLAHRPFMKAVLAHAFARGFLFRFLERQDIGHGDNAS